MSLGVRTWGNSASGADRSIICAYEGHSEVSTRLLDALPTVLVLRSHEWDTPLVDLLAAEAGRDGSGQEAYLDRLLDLLLIAVLRTWFDRAENAPAWWHAEQDPLVGQALRLIYNNPAHPWTVANLAAAVGSSRAAFARRFTELVGEPPIAFLTGWRLALAADLLRSSQATIAAVAKQVGYSTPFALSSAFKRAYGVSPNTHRAASVTRHRFLGAGSLTPGGQHARDRCRRDGQQRAEHQRRRLARSEQVLLGAQRRGGDRNTELRTREHRKGQGQTECPRSAMRKQGTDSQTQLREE